MACSRVPLRHVEAPAAVAALARAQWCRASSVGGTSWRFAQSRAAEARLAPLTTIPARPSTLPTPMSTPPAISGLVFSRNARSDSLLFVMAATIGRPGTGRHHPRGVIARLL